MSDSPTVRGPPLGVELHLRVDMAPAHMMANWRFVTDHLEGHGLPDSPWQTDEPAAPGVDAHGLNRERLE